MFVLKLKSGDIPLKWGTWAMRRACELKGTKNELGDIVPVGLDVFFSEIMPTLYADVPFFLRIAAECANRGPVDYTDFDYCDWIDECGGLVNVDSQIFGFMRYVSKTMSNDVTSLPGEAEEKKSETTA